MRGLLSFLILWILSKRPMNGQEISKEIATRRGARPTPGTVYPALRELRRKELVEMERKGRQTVYTISKKGTEGLNKACKYFCHAFGEIFEEHRGSTE
jgi:DNA-binding PadR family transcriptional regulator